MEAATPKIGRLVTRKVVLAILCALLVYFLACLPQYLREMQSPSWPTASGTIVVSQVQKGYVHPMGGMNFEGYLADIRYAYNVKGIDYEGTRVDFHLQQSLIIKENADGWVAMYPTGKVVSVYYDPKDASSAVLVPGIKSPQRDLFYIDIAFIVFTCFALVIVFFSDEKTKA